MPNKVKVQSDVYKLARAAAEYFVTLSQEMIIEKGFFSVVLSGGSTPENLYALIATDTYLPRVDWSKTYVFWGDERPVPPEDLDSNYRLASDTLLSNTQIPAENVFRIAGETPPEEAANTYEERLETFFAEKGLAEPQFDLVLLGLGSDGHTASLFPESDVLEMTDRWVAAHYVESQRSWRITMTAPLLNSGRNVMFYVSGTDKAEIVRDVLEGEPDRYPAQLIDPPNGRIIWLVDQDAAMLLTKR